MEVGAALQIAISESRATFGPTPGRRRIRGSLIPTVLSAMFFPDWISYNANEDAIYMEVLVSVVVEKCNRATHGEASRANCWMQWFVGQF